MTIAAGGFIRRDSSELKRWGASLVMVLALHAAAGLYLALRQVPIDAGDPPSAPVMLDLAPLPALTPPQPAPPEPVIEPQPQQQAESEPMPPTPPPEIEMPKVEPSPALQQPVALPQKPPPRPKPTPVDKPAANKPEQQPPPAAASPAPGDGAASVITALSAPAGRPNSPVGLNALSRLAQEQ